MGPLPLYSRFAVLDVEKLSLTESGSSLGVFMDCPKKYEFSYVKRLSSRFYPEAAGYGSLIHAIVEDIHLASIAGSPFVVETYTQVCTSPAYLEAPTSLSSPETPSQEAFTTSPEPSKKAKKKAAEEVQMLAVSTALSLVLTHPQLSSMRRQFQKYLQEFPNQAERVGLDCALALAVGLEWHKYWLNKNPGDLTPTSMFPLKAEYEWKWSLAGSTGTTGHRHVGKSDAVMEHQSYGTLLYELKTSGAPSRESYKHRLELDKQISSNLIALGKSGMNPRGVMYDVIWKPLLKLKKDRKTMPDETLAELYARIFQEVSGEPGKYFERMMVFRSERDHEEYYEDLAGQFDGVERAYARGHFYRNTNSCEKFGVLCPFFSACMAGGEHEEEYFRVREGKFPELEEANKEAS